MLSVVLIGFYHHNAKRVSIPLMVQISGCATLLVLDGTPMQSSHCSKSCEQACIAAQLETDFLFGCKS